MDNQKHYKFINSETGNVIYYLSLSEGSPDTETELEAARVKIAKDNGLYVGNVYFVPDIDEDDLPE